MITCSRCGGFISHDSSNLESLCSNCVIELTDRIGGHCGVGAYIWVIGEAQ